MVIRVGPVGLNFVSRTSAMPFAVIHKAYGPQATLLDMLKPVINVPTS